MNPTLLNVAEDTGVHISTVSRALRGDKLISPATARKVMRAANRLGYRANSTARALATGRHQRIAFWSPAMGARLFDEIAFRFQLLVSQQEFELVVGGLRCPDRGGHATPSFTRLDVDGILMYGGALGAMRKMMERTFPLKAPIINMGVQCAGKLDYVNIDLYPAAKQAVQHLLSSGRRRVAHLLPDSTDSDADGRWCAYRDALAEAGVETEHIFVPDWSRSAARRTLTQYVQTHGCPDAIFCANDDLAIGSYRGLRDLGIRIPDDVALVGCDGIEDTEYFDPPITTLSQPIEQMCQLAWQYLGRRMEEPDAPQQTCTLQAELVLRASSAQSA